MMDSGHKQVGEFSIVGANIGHLAIHLGKTLKEKHPDADKIQYRYFKSVPGETFNKDSVKAETGTLDMNFQALTQILQDYKAHGTMWAQTTPGEGSHVRDDLELRLVTGTSVDDTQYNVNTGYQNTAFPGNTKSCYGEGYHRALAGMFLTHMRTKKGRSKIAAKIKRWKETIKQVRDNPYYFNVKVSVPFEEEGN